jgi:methylenetetrahydrofolate reductase (NADPH)
LPIAHGLTYDKTHTQFRILPPQNPGGNGQTARHAPAACPAQPGIFFGHFRRRRLDPRPYAGNGDRNPAGRSQSRAAILDEYKSHGIRHIVALRGDLPSGTACAGEFRYANELVEFIRAETGDWFDIEVAAYPEFHPQAPSAQADLANFKRKVDAGANAAITQYFYNADAYFNFVDECEAMGITIPIVPGIMPIANFSQLARFSDACGAEIPRWLRLKLQGYGDDSASIRACGLDVVTGLCERLLKGGAPGLHFYTLNQAGLISTIWQRLGL